MSVLPYGSSSRFGWIAASGSSLAAHMVLGAMVIGAMRPLWVSSSLPESRPEYQITLQRLDSDTLAGLSVQDGLAGAEISPETTPEAQDSTVSAEKSGADLEHTEPEADTATLTPEHLEPVTPPTQTLSPIATPVSPVVPADAGPLVPLALAPLDVQPATVAPVVQTGPTLLTPTAQSGQVRVTDRNAAATPAPTAQDLAAKELIALIRSNGGPDCFLALPRKDGEDDVGLEMLSARDAAFSRFAEATLTGAHEDIRQTRTLLDPRQCPALAYIRQSKDYPITRLGLRLQSGDVTSGGRLVGVLRGTAGKYVSLLLVDNNGVVQSLQRFTTQSGNQLQFDVPVTRNGPVRDTAQMLLAIASSTPLKQIQTQSGQLAEAVFAGLSEPAALAVTTFEVN